LVELNVLKFVTWILPRLPARTFFSNQSKVGLARFENSNTWKYRPLVPRVNNGISWTYIPNFLNLKWFY
jgi:hypothetical protein